MDLVLDDTDLLSTAEGKRLSILIREAWHRVADLFSTWKCRTKDKALALGRQSRSVEVLRGVAIQGREYRSIAQSPNP